MTLAAFEVFLPMNIGLNSLIFAEILFFNSAPMTRSTDRMYRRPFLKEMPIEEATSGCVRTADMALPAAAVASSTMEFPCFIHLLVNHRLTSGALIDDFLIWREVDMEALLIVFCNIVMTCSATLRRVRVRWITNHAIMGGLPVRIVWIAAMALLTAELSMIFVLHKRAVDVDFFVRGQRLHFSASPLPFVFRRGTGPALAGFGNFSGDFYQGPGACVTGEAVIFTFRRINGSARGKGEQENSKQCGNGHCKPDGLHVLSSSHARSFLLARLIHGLNLSPFLLHYEEVWQFVCQMSQVKNEARKLLNDQGVLSTFRFEFPVRVIKQGTM
jgi:hypothetical protein